MKISLRCSVTCAHMNWDEMKLKPVWIWYRSFWLKSNFKPTLDFHVNKNLPEAKWISADSLDIAFNVHVCLNLIACAIPLQSLWQKLNFISDDKISCKHYPKWNVYVYPSKYRVVLKFSRNETTREQNLFPHRPWFETSNWYEFVLPLMWTYCNTTASIDNEVFCTLSRKSFSSCCALQTSLSNFISLDL